MDSMTEPSTPRSSSDREALPGLPSVEIPDPRVDVVAFRKTEDGKKLVSWAQSEYTRCKEAKHPKQRQWYINLSMVYGKQWIQVAKGDNPSVAGKITTTQAPRWMRRKTINRLRAYTRTELSKFLSTLPNIVAVPSTAEDEDVRAAFAAEQVWTSYAEMKKFRRQYTAAVWWAIHTGTGFIKTWWDPSVKVKLDNKGGEDMGDIEFRKVTPFHIYVPELREREIDDQPYVIEARVRTMEWVKSFYGDKLDDTSLSPSTNAANTILDETYLNLQDSNTSKDSVVVYEFWVKPGTTKLLPEGGFFVMVEDVLVDYYEGLPYTHGEFPYTKVEHLFNDTFWADSPLVDLIPLQKEYNEIRTDIGVSIRRMGQPQLLAAKGSIVPGKLTNEPGSTIIYQPGLPAPAPLPLSQLPQHVTDSQDRILLDFEDVSGQHDVSRGSAPAGVTAGTALAYLGERDDNFLTPQYQGIEDAIERVAKQTLMLFQQYVDLPRKIKVIGLDGAYDTLLLEGSDIENGTDVRVEPGSAVGQSQAAKQAQVMDLVSLGIIPPEQALKMLEIGGPQKILDIVNAAERKAQRENMKMKSFKDRPEEIEAANQEFMRKAVEEVGPELLAQGATPEQVMQEIQNNLPPVVAVDDFDIHEVHIETHNRFRMSQEYETLPDEVKEQFEKHVAWHQQMGAMMMQESLMSQMPPELAGEEEGQGALTSGPTSDTMAPTDGPPPGPPQ